MVDAGTGQSPAPSDRRWAIAIAGLVLGGLLLRLWGIRWGLPFAYNLDERSHFVPRAVAFFRDHSIDPAYQLNPSGLIELVAAALLVTHLSADAVVRAWQEDPGQVWTIARVASALLATAAIPLLYIAGKRLVDRTTGLVAAAILATAFLPVHYGHLALNDAPSLAFTALALVGAAGILRTGALRHYAIAGAGLGLAVGFKYNAGVVALPLLAAAALHARDQLRPAITGLVLAGVCALVAFAVCDPYALVHPRFFKDELQHLSDYTGGRLLLGETETSGYRYYGWSLLWGFGVVPLALAVAGAAWAIRRERRVALVLVPAVVLFFLVVGSQGRYFARYGMPVYPLLALLAGIGATYLARRLPARAWVAPVALLAICAQGLVMSVHGDMVLARDDTRSLAREWMVRNIPAGTYIAVEPMVPKEWYADGARLPDPLSHRGYRWVRAVRTPADSVRLAKQFPGAAKSADFANYGRTLWPGHLDYLRGRNVCWVVSGSLQSGRVFNNPDRVPAAVRYYRALARQGELRYRIAPFDGPEADHYFQYDFAINSAPLRFQRPGPTVRIYKLRDCTPRRRVSP
jgi:hypothetical protein